MNPPFSKANQLWREITAPILSILGTNRLWHYKTNSDAPNWDSELRGQDVLLVGTGPSIDNVPPTFFKNFDRFIFINYAVKFLKDASSAYFFSTDVDVVQRLCRSEYHVFLNSIKRENRIIAPVFLQQFPILDQNFRKSFSWIAPHRVTWSFPTVLLPISKHRKLRVPWIPRLGPAELTCEALDGWWQSDSQVSFFPVVRSTSALSAVLFAAKYKPKKITLIGCDFGEGRANALLGDLHPVGKNGFRGARKKFHIIKDYLGKRGVILENSSWKVR